MQTIGYFYPRSPRGERRASTSGTGEWLEFLSTLPARGATQVAFVDRRDVGISIHAPREGSDDWAKRYDLYDDAFLSTLPARGATVAGVRLGTTIFVFLSTLPVRGATDPEP